MGKSVKFVEPAFDTGGELWPALSGAPHADICALEDTIAKQSAELYQRLTEVFELYNAQQRQANELQFARGEIDRLNGTISAHQEASAQHKTDTAAAQNKIVTLENEKAALRVQRDKALKDSKVLAGQLLVTEAALGVRKTNAVSALEQVEFLNSELATTAAERFKLVATVHGEKRRHNQQTSILEDKIKKTEAIAATQEMQIAHLEAVRTKLDKRIQVLETLLRSEHEVAELKNKRLTEELQRGRSDYSATDLHEP